MPCYALVRSSVTLVTPHLANWLAFYCVKRLPSQIIYPRSCASSPVTTKIITSRPSKSAEKNLPADFGRVLESASECSRMLQSASECFKRLKNTSECVRLLHSGFLQKNGKGNYKTKKNTNGSGHMTTKSVFQQCSFHNISIL